MSGIKLLNGVIDDISVKEEKTEWKNKHFVFKDIYMKSCSTINNYSAVPTPFMINPHSLYDQCSPHSLYDQCSPLPL